MRHLRKHRRSSGIRASDFPTLIGFDEEDDDSEENSEEEDSEDDEEDDSEEDDDSEDDEEEGGKDTSGLKSALKKERAARKQLEKDLKELQKFKKEAEDADKSEVQKAKDKAEAAEKALETAQEQLRNTQLDFAIEQAARKQRFRDVDDALRLADRDSVEFDDDGEFDKKAVEKAVKAVADAKPHLVLSEGETTSGPSGSKFGGKKKNDKKGSEEKLKSKYPALGR